MEKTQWTPVITDTLNAARIVCRRLQLVLNTYSHRIRNLAQVDNQKSSALELLKLQCA